MFKSLFVVREDKRAKEPIDLAQMSIARCVGEDPAQELHFRDFLNRLEFEVGTEFFSSVMVCTSPASALRAVSAGRVDCALVSSDKLALLRKLSPGVTRGLRELFASEMLAVGPTCCRADLEREVQELRHVIAELKEHIGKLEKEIEKGRNRDD